MPTTVNGIGTTYFGKKNVEQYQGVCESCNNPTTLKDYETGYYFCIIFIPIIPLGRKMILGECPICTRHRSISISEWERIKEESISESVESLSENAEDPDKAVELLGTYTAFKQYDQAKQLAQAIKANHFENYDVMLSLGGWFEQMQMKQDADECFDQCLELDYDCTRSVNIRCITHIENKELSQAEPLAMQLFEEDQGNYAGVLFLLAGAYEESDQTSEAYDIYKVLLEGIPELADDKELAKEIRKLEKKLGITESIAPKKGFFGLFG